MLNDDNVIAEVKQVLGAEKHAFCLLPRSHYRHSANTCMQISEDFDYKLISKNGKQFSLVSIPCIRVIKVHFQLFLEFADRNFKKQPF